MSQSRSSGTALLTALDSNGKGTFQLLDENGKATGKKETYYESKFGPKITQSGIYIVKYTIDRKISRTSNRPYTAIYINEAIHTVPSTTTALKGLLHQATSSKLANGIIDSINFDRPINDVLGSLSDVAQLMKVPGIGKKSALTIINKLGAENFDEIELKLMKIFIDHGLVYPRAHKKTEFALAYFRRYPSELDIFAQNPYMLLRIADVKNSAKSKAVVDNNPSLSALSFMLKPLDVSVLKKEPRWVNHKYRMQAYLHLAIQDAMNNGDSVVLLDQVALSLSNYGINTIKDELDQSSCAHISEEVIRKTIHETYGLAIVRMRDGLGVELEGATLDHLIKWQRTIAKVSKALSSSTKTVFAKATAANMLKHAIDHADFELTREQKTGLKYAFGSNFSSITGTPGTGKTTVSQCFLNGVQLASIERRVPMLSDLRRTEKQTAFNTYILAPTGVAVQRIRLGLQLTDPLTGDHIDVEKVDHSEIKDPIYHFSYGKTCLGTLHSFLGYRGSGTWKIPKPHPSILFVDEASMVDEEPMYHLMEYIESCMEEDIPVLLLLSGDENQLPPVGIGFPFRDLLGMQTGAVMPVSRLSLPQRQKESSKIVIAANEILQGRPPTPVFENHDKSDFYWAQPKTAKETYDAGALLKAYQTYLRKYQQVRVKEEDIQIIVPLRNESKVESEALNVNALNILLQTRYAKQKRRTIYEFKAANENDEERTFSVKFALGDKILHSGPNGYTKENSEPIMRGSIGYVSEIFNDIIYVKYPWLTEEIPYETNVEHSYIRLAYAITGHAAQGSEFDYVLLAVPFRAGPGLVDRSWLYTAITRAKKHMMLVAPQYRVNKAVQTNQGMTRRTMLASTVVYQQYS